MPSHNFHVVPYGQQWAVRREGASRVSSIYNTQAKAIQNGRRSAVRSEGELRIHGRDGKIRDSDSYGRDPFPPRDRRH